MSRLAAAFAAAFAAVLALALPGTASAAADYCRYGERTVMLLVDRTTAYDDKDLEVLMGGLDRIFSGLGTGDRFVVHTIAGDYTSSTRAFERCVPGCPEGGGLADWAFGSCSNVAAQADRRRFREELARVLRDMIKNPQQFEHSDIFRTLSESVRSVGADGRLKRVYVFSDLIENSPLLTWSALQAAAPEKSKQTLLANGVKADLRGARVDVFGFGRSHDPGRAALAKPLENKLQQLWGGWLRESGAGRVEIGRWLAID